MDGSERPSRRSSVQESGSEFTEGYIDVLSDSEMVQGDMGMMRFTQLDYLTDYTQEQIDEKTIDASTIRNPYPMVVDVAQMCGKLVASCIQKRHFKPRAFIDSVFSKLVRTKYSKVLNDGFFNCDLRNNKDNGRACGKFMFGGPTVDIIMDSLFRMIEPGVVAGLPLFNKNKSLMRTINVNNHSFHGFDYYDKNLELDINMQLRLTDDYCRSIGKKFRAVIIESPHHQLGVTFKLADLEAILKTGVLVIVNEEMLDFDRDYLEHTALNLVNTRQYDNLVVVSSMSYWCSADMLNVGYCFSSNKILLSNLRRVTPVDCSPMLHAHLAYRLSKEESLIPAMENVQKAIQLRASYCQMLGDAFPFVKIFPAPSGPFLSFRMKQTQFYDMYKFVKLLESKNVYVETFEIALCMDRDATYFPTNTPTHTFIRLALVDGQPVSKDGFMQILKHCAGELEKNAEEKRKQSAAHSAQTQKYREEIFKQNSGDGIERTTSVQSAGHFKTSEERELAESYSHLLSSHSQREILPKNLQSTEENTEGEDEQINERMSKMQVDERGVEGTNGGAEVDGDKNEKSDESFDFGDVFEKEAEKWRQENSQIPTSPPQAPSAEPYPAQSSPPKNTSNSTPKLQSRAGKLTIPTGLHQQLQAGTQRQTSSNSNLDQRLPDGSRYDPSRRFDPTRDGYLQPDQDKHLWKKTTRNYLMKLIERKLEEDPFMVDLKITIERFEKLRDAIENQTSTPMDIKKLNAYVIKLFEDCGVVFTFFDKNKDFLTSDEPPAELVNYFGQPYKTEWQFANVIKCMKEYKDSEDATPVRAEYSDANYGRRRQRYYERKEVKGNVEVDYSKEPTDSDLRRIVVIDGSNIAIAAAEAIFQGKKFFYVKGLESCVRFFTSRGHKVFITVQARTMNEDQVRNAYDDTEEWCPTQQLWETANLDHYCDYWKWCPDDIDALLALRDDPQIEIYKAPAGQHDDNFMLELAADVDVDGCIVSTDHYRDWTRNHPQSRWAKSWVDGHRISGAFIKLNDEVVKFKPTPTFNWPTLMKDYEGAA